MRVYTPFIVELIWRTEMEQDDPRKEPDVDAGFARRMRQACDRNEKIPAENDGRLVWILKELKTRHGMKIVLQSVHRWYHGKARPRNQKLIALAQVLNVDVGWLAHGLGDVSGGADTGEKETPVIRDGAINVVAGMMEMSGINCAWPEPDDPAAEYVHFYAIIKGKQRRFHVVTLLGQKEGGHKLRIPVDYAKCNIVLLRRVATFSFDVWLVPNDRLEGLATPRGGYAELPISLKGSTISIGAKKTPSITSFQEAFS